MLGLTLSCASFLLFDLLFSMVKLICILRQQSKSLLRMRSGALFGGLLQAHNLACSYPNTFIGAPRARMSIET